MDAVNFKQQSDSLQSEIFSEKINQLKIKLNIERIKTTGYRHDERTAQIQTNTKAIKTEIAQVQYSMASTDLNGIRGKAVLNEQRWRVELEGGRDELVALQESVQIKIASMRQKNLAAMANLD